jgi:hypothetical protein
MWTLIYRKGHNPTTRHTSTFSFRLPTSKSSFDSRARHFFDDPRSERVNTVRSVRGGTEITSHPTSTIRRLSPPAPGKPIITNQIGTASMTGLRPADLDSSCLELLASPKEEASQMILPGILVNLGQSLPRGTIT